MSFLVILFRGVYLCCINPSMQWESCILSLGCMVGNHHAIDYHHRLCFSFEIKISWH